MEIIQIKREIHLVCFFMEKRHSAHVVFYSHDYISPHFTEMVNLFNDGRKVNETEGISSGVCVM